MKKLSRILSVLLAAMVLFVSIPTQAEAATVKLNKTKATVYIGSTTTLKVTGTSKEAKWSSSNKKVATVDNKGVVTPKKEGTATITAKVGKKSYKCEVTVKKPYLNATKKTIYIGTPYTLKLKGTSIASVKSSNTKVATISKNGKVTGKKEGSATITLKGTDGKSYKCKVTVKKPYINTTSKTIRIGEPYVLKLVGTNIKSVKSSNKSVATVDKTGRVIGKSVGTATISITGKDKKVYKCNVTIQSPAKAYDGYDEFGNGYVIGEDGARHFDCPCPYTLYTVSTYKGNLGLKGQEGYFAYGATNVDRDAEYKTNHPEVWDMIAILCEKYNTSHGTKEVGWYPDTLYVVWQGFSNK